jgi:hypothetical protein
VVLLSYAAELVLVGVVAFLFFLAILVLLGLEELANERGGSLVRHGRSGSRSNHRQERGSSWHVDEALSTALGWLAEGRDEADVAAMLNIRTHRGEDLGAGARVHYDGAMDALREADSWDWVYQAGERRRALDEAGRELRAARMMIREMNR